MAHTIVTMRQLNNLQEQAQQEEEKITWADAHLFFQRDPRGFINLMRTRDNLHIGQIWILPNVLCIFA